MRIKIGAFSSTRIQDCLQQGDLATLAKYLLGRDYAITGMVEHGDKIGPRLSFPPPMLPKCASILPCMGFAVSVHRYRWHRFINTGEEYSNWRADLLKAVCLAPGNVGTRPALKKKYGWNGDWKSIFRSLMRFVRQRTDGDVLHFYMGKNYARLDVKQGIAQDVVDLPDWREQQALQKSLSHFSVRYPPLLPKQHTGLPKLVQFQSSESAGKK